MLSINFSELIWTIINFLLLFFVLKRFLFKPLLSFMDARQAKIDAGTEAERQARAKLDENAQDLAGQKAETRRRAQTILDEAAAQDAKRTAEAYAKAREDAKTLRATEEERLKEHQARESEELKTCEPELAALLAAHLLGEEK